MAYSYNVYTGNGSTTQFTVGVPYIRKEHIKVYVAYVDTAYTYVNDTTVQLAAAPGAGVRVEVRRVTPATTPLVDFADGSTLVAADLDTSNLQHLYLEQELDDANKQAIFVDPATGLLTAANQRITNVADPVNAQDVSTKAYTDAQIDSALINDVIAGAGLTISDNTPTAGQITVGITNSGVGATQIADGAVTSAKIADATIITGDLADGAVTSAKIADGTIVAGDLASDSVTTAKILNANVTTAKIADLNVTTGKIADLGVTTGKIADAAVTAAKIAGGSIDSTKLDGATVVTNSEHSGSTPNDTSFFTTSASDARYFRQDSSETISSGNTWSASDSYVATTAAIDARVIDLVDDVGGFVPIANENSFPVANPDINNPDGTGTIVSIAVMSTSRTPSSGTVTIANGSGSNTVTITGCGSTVLAAGFGVLVETTSTLHTYTFHRLTPKATEVTTVASISADVTTVAGNNANVTAVAGNAANITTVAGSIANVNAVGGSIANVNSVASNLASVNSFANTYRIAASDPATSLDVGDLVFNTTSSELRVYNGSAWQGGVTATGNLVSRSGDTMTGALAYPLGAAATPSITFTGDTNTGIYSPGADQVAISTAGSGRLFVDASGNVGVGTSSPTYKLESSGATNALKLINSTTYDVRFVEQNSLTNIYSYGSLDLSINTRFSNDIRFKTNDLERLRITSAGLVGVGTSSPNTTLHVVGSSGSGAIQIGNAVNTQYHYINFGGSTSINDAWQLGRSPSGGIGPTNGFYLYDLKSSATRLAVDTSGRVGIGTSSFTNNVLLSLKANIATTTPGILLEDSGASGRKYGIYSGGGTFSFRDFTAGQDRLVIDSSGRCGFGTASPGSRLDVAGPGIAGLQPVVTMRTGAGNSSGLIFKGNYTNEEWLIDSNYNAAIAVGMGGSEKLRVTSSGQLLVGTSTSTDTGGLQPNLQVVGASAAAGSIGIRRDTNDTGSPYISIGKSRGSGITIVQANDPLGELRFSGADGTDTNSLGAAITAYVDGTPGTNDMPGRLVFSTTADGAASPTERFRIGSAGQLGIGGATYGTAGQVLTSGGASAAPTWSTISGTPAGAVDYFAMSSAPTGYLKANGAAISRTTYSALFTAIGTTFGVGDGSTTFNVPDLRGEFIRGWDDSRGVDSGRVFGSTQADDFESHTHSVSNISSSSAFMNTTPSYSNVYGGGSRTTDATGGTETRPRNIALLACIKF